MADIIIKPSDWNIQASKYGIKPGDRVILQGNRGEIEFRDLKGTKEKPIIITATEKVLLKRAGTGGRVVHFFNCDYIVFTGTDKKLIEITGGGHGVTFHDGSNHLEVSHLHIHHVGYSGIDITNYPTCDPKTWRGSYVMEDIIVRDNLITDLADGEAVYIAGSHHHTSFPLSNCPSGVKSALEHDAKNIHVVNNVIRNVGADAIQVGSATGGGSITGNIIGGFGTKKVWGQSSGVQVNPGSSLLVENNVINGGTSFGIIVQGRTGTVVRRNRVSNTIGGIMTVARESSDKGTFLIENNTFTDITGNGLEAYSPTNFTKNVLQVNVGQKLYMDYSGAKLRAASNLELSGNSGQLGLDATGVPTASSMVPAGLGWKDYKKPEPKIVREAGSVELITTDGIDTWWITVPSGKRKKIE